MTFAPDDMANSTHSHGSLISFRSGSPALQSDSELSNMTSQDAGTWILERTPATFQVRSFAFCARALYAEQCDTENDGEQLLVRD